MASHEEAKEKISAGWFHVWVAFEGMAINKNIIKTTLEDLVSKLETDPRAKVYEKEFLEPSLVKNPMKGVEEGWSQAVSLKLAIKTFKDLVQLTIEYGPSAVEVLEPSKSQLSMSDAQEILNNVAGMMHRFAAAGIGGTVIVSNKKQ